MATATPFAITPPVVRRKTTPDELLAGVRLNVYRAQDGAWHAHVTLPGGWPNLFDGCVLPLSSRGSEWIARRVERDVEAGGDLHTLLRDVRVLYPVSVMPNPGYWTDVGYCSTEGEARDRACMVIGHVYGRRLAQALGNVEVPARAFRGVSAHEFGARADG